MTQMIVEKIERIEELLLEINGKIDNFMGFEDLSEIEKEEVRTLREEVRSREYLTFDEVFEE